MNKGSEVRGIVLDMLMEITAGREYSHILIRNVLDKHDYMEARDKAFIKRLTEGTLERMIQLDHIIDQVSSLPVRRMKPLIRNLLRMSAYQILFMDQVPDSAVCNEAVKLAKKRNFGQLGGFVNGVLRGLIRSRDQIVYPDSEKEPAGYLSVMYSMPKWLVELWLPEYGKERTERLLGALLQERPVTVRLRENLPKEKKEAALRELAESGLLQNEPAESGLLQNEPAENGLLSNGSAEPAIRTVNHPYLPYAYELKSAEGLSGLKAFRDGSLYVQDVSSMLAVECAGISPGDQVLDVCAAPGGKSLHAADKLLAAEGDLSAPTAESAPDAPGAGAGHVEARDISEEKTALIRENIARLGLHNISVRLQDASVPDQNSVETADVLLLDIPCSGLGVMGRKRDIKYRVEQEKLPSLLALQKSIIDTCLSYVKPGGTVIYSTCTIHRAENEAMREYMLEAFPLSPESLDPYLPTELRSETTAQGYIQLLPGEHQSDGFFIARFRRQAQEWT